MAGKVAGTLILWLGGVARFQGGATKLRLESGYAWKAGRHGLSLQHVGRWPPSRCACCGRHVRRRLRSRSGGTHQNLAMPVGASMATTTKASSRPLDLAQGLIDACVKASGMVGYPVPGSQVSKTLLPRSVGLAGYGPASTRDGPQTLRRLFSCNAEQGYTRLLRRPSAGKTRPISDREHGMLLAAVHRLLQR
jgi:hypothetical protein